jgi:hypothetical protein
VGQTQFRWLNTSTAPSCATGKNYIHKPPEAGRFQQYCCRQLQHSADAGMRRKFDLPLDRPLNP